MKALNRWCAGLGAMVLALAATGAAHAAGLVVIEARGVPFQAGQTIDGTQPIKLAVGQKLSLIAENGNTIRLRGPFEGPPAPAGAAETGNVVTALLNLGKQTESVSGSLGVVRAGGDERVAPEPRFIDITRPGHRCLIADAQPVFWWPDRGQGAAKIDISPADRSWRARASWPADSDRLALPANLPLRDGQTYLVEIGNATSALTIHFVPAAVSAEAVRAAWMLEKGCFGQAVALARSEAQ
jgi:hypothetical protein